MDFVAIDIETTGFSHIYDTILQIGAVKVINDKVVGEFNRYIFTSKEIPLRITELTGITNEFLNKNGESYHIVLTEFLQFVENHDIIAHNASFDYRFIERKVGAKLNKTMRNKIFCTKELARKRLGKTIPNHKLDTVARHFGIDNPRHHNGLNDAKVCADIALAFGGKPKVATVQFDPLDEILNNYSQAWRNHKD